MGQHKNTPVSHTGQQHMLKKISAINLIYEEWSFLWPYSTSSWKLRDILNQSCFHFPAPRDLPASHVQIVMTIVIAVVTTTWDDCLQSKGFSCLIPSPVFSSSTTTLPSYIRITNGYITVKPPIWISNRLDQRPRPDRPSQPQPTSSAPARRLWPPLTSLCLATAAFLLNLLQPSWPH